MPINIKTGTFLYLHSVYESEKNALIERIGFLSDSEPESENKRIEVKKEHAALQRRLAALAENENNKTQESVLMLDGYRSAQDVACPKCLVHTTSKIRLRVLGIDHDEEMVVRCNNCGLQHTINVYITPETPSVPYK